MTSLCTATHYEESCGLRGEPERRSNEGKLEAKAPPELEARYSREESKQYAA